MSEKKQLNEQELEKVSGGFNTITDPLIGTTVTLYYETPQGLQSISAKVLNAGTMDYFNSGTYYEVNVDNGFAIGWLNPMYFTDGEVFSYKNQIREQCMSLDQLNELDDLVHSVYGNLKK